MQAVRVNDLAGYMKFQVSPWEDPRFKAILHWAAMNGLERRRKVSRRTFTRARDAIVYRDLVEKRLAGLQGLARQASMKEKQHADATEH